MKKLCSVAFVLLFSLCALAGCAKTVGSDATMEAIYQEIALSQDVGLPTMLKLGDTQLLDFAGIESNAYEEYAAYVAADGVQADAVFLFKAKSEDDAHILATSLETYRKQKASEAENYQPAQFAVIQSAQVVQKGVFVHLIISGAREAAIAIVDSHIK